MLKAMASEPVIEGHAITLAWYDGTRADDSTTRDDPVECERRSLSPLTEAPVAVAAEVAMVRS